MSEIEPLTMPLARQVFMLSFFFSQGEPGIQRDLFRAIALLRPAWRLSPEGCEALRRMAPSVPKLAVRGVHKPFTLSDASIEREIQDQMVNLHHALEHPPRTNEREELLYQLISEFIRRDHDYLVIRGQRPRPNASGDERGQPHHDAHLSHFCHYVLLGHSTGCAVFDALFQQMADVLNHQQWRVYDRLMEHPQTMCQRLPEVIAAHNRWHPEAQVPLPEDQISEAG